MLIAFEGLDGCGKSTQITRAGAWLRSLHTKVVTTFEPSKGNIGTFLRAQLTSKTIDEKALALLFAADRLQHVEDEIKPVQDVVLCDRYILSSLAYQSHTLPMDWVFAINQHALKPDATLFFKISPQTALKRLQQREEALTRFETLERLQEVATLYEEAMKKYPELGKCYTIDAEADIETVTQKTHTILQTILSI